MCNDGSCTLRCKAIFLAGWSIGHGLLTMIFSIHRYRVAGGTWFLNGDYFLLVVISGALSVIGGVIMLIAIFKGMKWLHVLGLILSWFLPVFIGFFIYPLVVHIIFTICVARYYKEMSNQRFPY